jgi:hypothetical protein
LLWERANLAGLLAVENGMLPKSQGPVKVP